MYKSINQVPRGSRSPAAVVENPDFLENHLRADTQGHQRSLCRPSPISRKGSPHFLSLTSGNFRQHVVVQPAGGHSAGSDAVNAINRAEVEMGLPSNITGEFAGTARAYQGRPQKSAHSDRDGAARCLYCLGELYESLIHPLTIISTLPSAGVGALVAMVLFRSPLDIIGMIGIIR